MDLEYLSEDDKALVERTRLFLRRRRSDISGVSAGLRTSTGKEYFGLCIDAKAATVGVCAEYSAVGAMVSDGGSRIRTVVAVVDKGHDRYSVLPPCGKCRDLVRAFGNPFVVLQVGRGITELKKVRVSELIPFPWN
jgi:cytidine deaminase